MANPLTRRSRWLLVGEHSLVRGSRRSARGRGFGWAASQPRASRARTRRRDANTPFRASRLAQAAITFRGGPITTSSGETVNVRVSDSAPAESLDARGLGRVLAGLTHGPEITRLRTYIATFDEMRGICGRRARLLQPGPAGRARASLPDGHDRGGGRPPRVRPPHRALPLNTPWARSTGARSDGRPRPTSVRASRGARRSPATRDELRAEPRRGVGGDVSPDGRAQGRDHDCDVADHRPELLSRTSRVHAAEQDVVQPWTAPQTTTGDSYTQRRRSKVWCRCRSRSRSTEPCRISARVPNSGTHDVALVAADRRTVRQARSVGRAARLSAWRARSAVGARSSSHNAGRCARARSCLGDDAVIALPRGPRLCRARRRRSLTGTGARSAITGTTTLRNVTAGITRRGGTVDGAVHGADGLVRERGSPGNRAPNGVAGNPMATGCT